MEPRITEGDLALLLLDQDDLVALGAMLSLPAETVELAMEDDED